jgi:16S rRNA (guanine527-N7)-methyltransferase
MSLPAFGDVLIDKAAEAGLSIRDELLTPLAIYFQVLSYWNKKINLTSLSNPDAAVERLLLEPVAAAAYLPRGDSLIDLGSGGGSPAIPLALATGASRLVMVESRARRAAFLREVVRELRLAASVSVEVRRFEDLPGMPGAAANFGVVSVRAVRLDSTLFSVVADLLRPDGVAALFRTVDAEDPPPGLPQSLIWASTRQLIAASRSSLTTLRRST